MNNLKQKHKDYLIKNEIKDLTDLVNYVEILRNTSNLKGEDRQMLFDFAFLITNEQLSLKSFFAANKNKMGCSPTPSREFFNAFKKFAENEDKNSPTFMDEVLDSNTTRTEVPNFNIIDIKQVLPKHVFDTIEKQEDKKEGFNSSDHYLADEIGYFKQCGKKERGVKLDSKKPKIALLFKQFPKALEAIARCSEYGHEKYRETDSDYLNFKRVKEGSDAYANAGLRHRLQKGIDLESMLPHSYHTAWNALAELEILLEENE